MMAIALCEQGLHPRRKLGIGNTGQTLHTGKRFGCPRAHLPGQLGIVLCDNVRPVQDLILLRPIQLGKAIGNALTGAVRGRGEEQAIQRLRQLVGEASSPWCSRIHSPCHSD